MAALAELRDRIATTEFAQTTPREVTRELEPAITGATLDYMARLACRRSVSLSDGEFDDFACAYKANEMQFATGVVFASLSQLARARQHVRQAGGPLIRKLYIGTDLDNTQVPFETGDPCAREDLRTGFVPAVRLVRNIARRITGVDTKVLVSSDRAQGVLDKEAPELLKALDTEDILDRLRIWSVRDSWLIRSLPPALLTCHDRRHIPESTIQTRIRAVDGYIQPAAVSSGDGYHERAMPYILDAAVHRDHAYIALDDTGGWTESLDSPRVGAIRVYPAWDTPKDTLEADFIRSPLYPSGDDLMYHKKQ